MHRKKFDTILKSVSSLFRLLSHADRIRMVGLLKNGEMDVTQLHQVMGVSQSVVSQHLKLFKLHGLVNERREGTHVYYSLKGTILSGLVALAIESQTQELSQHGQETMALLEEIRDLWRQDLPGNSGRRKA